MLRRIPPARVLVSRILLLAALAAYGSVLRADAIAGNILSGDNPYSNEGALTVTDNTNDYMIAQEFSVTGANYDVSGIQFVVGSSDDPDEIHTITMQIFADDDGEPAANPIDTLTYTGTVFPFTGDLAPILTLTQNPQQTTELSAGDSYWLVMSGPADESLVWYQNLAGESGILTTNGVSPDWITNDGTQGAFEVDGNVDLSATPAPEPSAGC